MKKLILIFLFLSLSGCGLISGETDYQASVQAKKESNTNIAINQRMAIDSVFHHISTIIKPFEKQYTEENKESTENLVAPEEGNIDHYAIYVLGKININQGKREHERELARIRVEVFRYLQPIIESIYSQQYEQMGTPMTINQVVSKLFDQIPFVATVAGMYGLGVEGMRKAGDEIYNTIEGDNNGNINSKGTQYVADSGSNIAQGNNGSSEQFSAGITEGEGEEGGYNGIPGCSGAESYYACHCEEGPEYCTQ